MSDEGLRLLSASKADECERAVKTTGEGERNFRFGLAEQYTSFVTVLRQIQLDRITGNCLITL
jgi:hypothetical protein